MLSDADLDAIRVRYQRMLIPGAVAGTMTIRAMGDLLAHIDALTAERDAERELADELAAALGAAHDALRELRGGDDDDGRLIALTGNDGWRALVDELGAAHDRYRAARAPLSQSGGNG